MKLTYVVAVSDNEVIGVDNQLPWHLPHDLKFFKKNTLGKPVIMGKNTFWSMGKALPGRLNIVLSRSLASAPEGTLLFANMEEALNFLKTEGQPEACVIGGGEIFKAYRDMADELLLTRVHTNIDNGTAFFQLPDQRKWMLVWSEAHHKDEKHAFDFTFERWLRR
ncbi:MAG TPA: dihydrofolate reductase [Edaphocola sp.]|nr:dihydrofolate reductase [Edaphocola sp.]